jgi:hypothetical protein
MEGMERNIGASYFLARHVCPAIVYEVLNIEAPMHGKHANAANLFREPEEGLMNNTTGPKTLVLLGEC